MSSEGCVALVTGGNRGIGFEIARLLGREGGVVFVGARSEKRGLEAARRLRSEVGGDAEALTLDISDEASVLRAVEEVARRTGRLDVLINNAGVMVEDCEPSSTSAASIEAAFAVNVVGAILMMVHGLPLLRCSDSPRVVNVTSRRGLIGLNAAGAVSANLSYNMSKAALNMATVLFSKEYAQHRVAVNAVRPGFVATRMNKFRGTRSAAEGAASVWRVAMEQVFPSSGHLFGPSGDVEMW